METIGWHLPVRPDHHRPDLVFASAEPSDSKRNGSGGSVARVGTSCLRGARCISRASRRHVSSRRPGDSGAACGTEPEFRCIVGSDQPGRIAATPRICLDTPWILRLENEDVWVANKRRSPPRNRETVCRTRACPRQSIRVLVVRSSRGARGSGCRGILASNDEMETRPMTIGSPPVYRRIVFQAGDSAALCPQRHRKSRVDLIGPVSDLDRLAQGFSESHDTGPNPVLQEARQAAPKPTVRDIVIRSLNG